MANSSQFKLAADTVYWLMHYMLTNTCSIVSLVKTHYTFVWFFVHVHLYLEDGYLCILGTPQITMGIMRARKLNVIGNLVLVYIREKEVLAIFYFKQFIIEWHMQMVLY